MAIALSEFWSQLQQSGITGADGCKQLARAFKEANSGASPRDSEQLSAFLVRAGVLTAHQAGALLAGTPPLRLGGFVITSDRPVTPLVHWLPVQTAVEKDGQTSRPGFLLRIPLASLDATRQRWLRVHNGVKSPSLQAIELSGGAQADDPDKSVLIFSPLDSGACLAKSVSGKSPWEASRVISLGIDLANALEAMHQTSAGDAPLTHGAVGADHVWLTSKGAGVLLRDPSSPARSPLADQSVSWIERREPPARYAAPELADPTVLPTPQSDVYSLGCLLFSLVTGKPPFAGDDPAELFAAHQNVTPDELRLAAEQGSKGDPVLRVLAYAMAKDPSARFGSAAAMADALQRVGQLVNKRSDSTISRSATKKRKAKAEPSESKPTSQPSAAKSPEKSRKPATTSPQPATPSEEATQPASEKNVRSTPSESKPKKSKKQQPRKSKEPAATSTPPPPPVTAEPPPVASAPADSASAADQVEAPPAASVASTIEVSPPATEPEPPQIDTGVTAIASSEPIDEPSSADGEPLAPRRRRRTRRKNRIPILAGMMVLPVLLLGFAILMRGKGPEKPKPRPRPTRQALTNVPNVGEARRTVPVDDGPEIVGGYEIVDSDRLLWAPPYAADSSPPSLELLPPGPAAVLSISIDTVNRDAAFGPLRSVFGSELGSLWQMVSDRAGVAPEQIRRCTVAVFPGSGGWPEATFAIELAEARPAGELIDSWGVAESRTPDGAVLYSGDEIDSDAYYLGGGENGKLANDAEVKRFAVGSPKRILEVAENEGGTIPLPRSMQTLWDATSDQCDFVALVTPNFLFADARELFGVVAPEFREPAKRWLIPDVSAFSLAVAASAETTYIEVRQMPAGGATPATVLRSFRESIDAWPEWADDFIIRAVPDRSWRLLSSRLPLMLQFIGGQTRSTIVGDAVVASAYLPTDAAAQVTLGVVLAMNTPAGAGADVEMAAPEQKTLTVEEMLNRPMSISFTQESLEFAIKAVVDEFKFGLPPGATMPNARIIGGDLELSGITQNQQIRDFTRSDKPLREVLTDLVLGANPDKTATGPKDEKQMLVWVVHPVGKPPAESEILITTRAVAEGKYELPPEFKPE